MFDFLFPRDFWKGLPQKRSARGKALLNFGAVFVLLAIMPIIAGVYWVAPLFISSGLLLLLIFFLTFRKRLEAWWNNEGWRCPKCKERIGFGDIGEAFLLRGKMGNLTESLTAWVECSQKHRSQINWKDTENILFTTLRDHIQTAERRAILNKDKEDQQSQEVYRAEQIFVDRAALLYNDAIVQEPLYNDPATLHQKLMNYSNQRWTPENREILYDLLANTIAYLRVKEAYEEQGLTFKTNGERDRLVQEHPPLRIYPEQIESFAHIKSVSTSKVNRFLNTNGYFDRSEEFIQLALEDILNEKLHKKDWGGENNDLYTSNIIYNGQRRAAAFVLKGNGLKVNLLKQKHIGYNGDQTIKAFNSPAEIFILQFVGNIDENVIQGLELGVQGLRHQGRPAYYCIINGQDTARLLYAYGKI